MNHEENIKISNNTTYHTENSNYEYKNLKIKKQIAKSYFPKETKIKRNRKFSEVKSKYLDYANSIHSKKFIWVETIRKEKCNK